MVVSKTVDLLADVIRQAVVVVQPSYFCVISAYYFLLLLTRLVDLNSPFSSP